MWKKIPIDEYLAKSDIPAALNIRSISQSKITALIRSMTEQKANQYAMETAITNLITQSVDKQKETIFYPDLVLAVKIYMSQERHHNIINFTSESTEELIQNVNNLHFTAKQEIENHNLDRAIILLDAAYDQYTQILEKLNDLNLEEPIVITENKRDAVELLKFQIQKQIFAKKNQRLNQLLQEYKDQKEYSKIQVILDEMKDYLDAQLIFATKTQQNDKTIEYKQMIENLKEQIDFNSIFVEFQQILEKFNQIVELIKSGSLQDSLTLLKDFLPEIANFLRSIDNLASDHPKISLIYDQVTNMESQANRLKTDISKQYSQLLLGQQQNPIEISEFNSKITIPQLNTTEIQTSLEQVLMKLDEQFAQWEQKETNKVEKI
jgi:hypothetical protein